MENCKDIAVAYIYAYAAQYTCERESVSNPVGKAVCNLLYVYPAVTSTGPSLHKDVASMVNR